MTDNTDLLQLDFAERGGLHRLRSMDDVRVWIEREFDAWRWMATERPDRFRLWNHVSGRLKWLQDAVQQGLDQGHPLSKLAHHFRQVFGDNVEAVLHSESDLGRIVLDIRESEGAASAFAAYATAQRRVSLAQLSDPAEVRGCLLIFLPSLVRPEALQRRLTQERRNLRERADRLIRTLEEEGEQRKLQYENELQQGRKIGITVAKRRFARWARRFTDGEAAAKAITETFEATHKATQEDFNTLRVAFLETMRLKAPATYWSEKAKKHKEAETCAMWRLIGFFPQLSSR